MSKVNLYVVATALYLSALAFGAKVLAQSPTTEMSPTTTMSPTPTTMNQGNNNNTDDNIPSGAPRTGEGGSCRLGR